MDSARPCLLTTLLVFKNTIREELIRTVHVYQLGDGKQSEVEREYLFSNSGSYGEMPATPIIRLQKFRVTEVPEGYQNGVWLCIFAFHADKKPQFTCIPSLLSVRRNPKLQMIPSLLNDLHLINKLDCRPEAKEILKISPEERSQENNHDYRTLRKSGPVLNQDLNCLPYPDDSSESDNELVNGSLPGMLERKKRAASDHIAKLALSDLVRYFDMPIVEASRSLNVGLTVLKRKCREFGIPRWPHRKIKSLDSLIQDLQEEAKHKQLEENKAAAMAVMRRQKMLQSEKESIERKPFMDIQKETKRFRQDVFKKRHRARALEKQSSTVSGP